MRTGLDPEILGAYVDGELSPPEAGQVEKQLAESPEDRRTVETVREMNAQLSSAFGAPLREPLPPSLVSRLAGAAVRPTRRVGISWWFAAGTALAASVATAAILLGAHLGDAADPRLAAGDIPPSSPLHMLLEFEPDGAGADVGRGTATLSTTFIDGRGDACREVEWYPGGGASSAWAIACRRDEEWLVEIAMARPAADPGESDAYVPASGADEAVMDAALEALRAGPVLGPDEVESLIDADWEPL